ncbi:MAG: transcriptional repressor [Patescibacteria group bacterium]|nr:transcriptional repressor [Patescibacteria group bacterium]
MKTHYYKDNILAICDKRHLTVEQIFEEISNKFSDAGKSSIYRNVEDMVKK